MAKRVLIVDDESALADLLSDILGHLEIETKVLTDGVNVLQTALEWKPDLITLDIQMPGKNGVECLYELKENPETRNIPVVIISVVAKRADIFPHLASAERILEKPLSVQRVLSCVSEIIPAD